MILWFRYDSTIGESGPITIREKVNELFNMLSDKTVMDSSIIIWLELVNI